MTNSPDHDQLSSSETNWSGSTIIILIIGTQQALTNSVDPDQTLQYAESDQGLHCLPYIQQ